MKKTIKLKSCLVLLLEVIIIIFAIGYEFGTDWIVDLISAKTLMIGAMVAAFFNVYGTFDLGIESDNKKKNKLSIIKDKLEDVDKGIKSGEFIRITITLVGAIKAFISQGVLGSIAGSSMLQWLIAIVIGLLILFLIEVVARVTQYIVYIISNWEEVTSKSSL